MFMVDFLDLRLLKTHFMQPISQHVVHDIYASLDFLLVTRWLVFECFHLGTQIVLEFMALAAFGAAGLLIVTD